MLIASPITTYAGLLSFFTDLFDTNANAYDESAAVINSQTMSLLQAAVNSDPIKAQGGGDITVVDGTALLAESGPSGTLADITEYEPSSDQISLYVVREGDSLSRIAQMFDVTTNTIIWANDIKRSTSIQPGDELIILPISGIRHTVKKGETLASIAKKYKGDLGEIRQYNDLSEGSTLAVGNVVIIPDGEMSVATPRYVGSRNLVRGAGGPEYVGYYLRPIVGGRKSQGLHGYNAVDFAAPVGTPIVAAAEGTVIISRNYGWNGGYGKYIVIRHSNGTQTLYSHNSSNIVSGGQYVRQGQIIGYVGSSGKSTGPHVHFEIRGAKNPF